MKTRTSFSEIYRPHVRLSLAVVGASVLVVVCLIGTVLPLRANNISISSVSVSGRDVSAGANNAANFVSVLMNVSWDNSWRRSSTGNWDAAWLFVKFRKGASDPTFTSVTSSSTTVTVPSTASLRVGMPVIVTAGTGAFAANTVIASITNSTQFVVSATPTTPLSGASITCYRIWEHARLHNSGHVTGSIGTAGAISVGLLTPSAAFNASTNPGLGVFLYRSVVGSGTFTSSNVQLRWNYGANGLNDNDSVDVNVFAIEMVYVPQGSFYVGSGGTESGSFTNGSWTNGNTIPLQITSESALTVGQSAGNLWGTSSAGASAIGSAGTLAAAFPKGFTAFYCMKYEMSQGQYRDFLNTLTYTQQATRTATAPNSNAGTFSFPTSAANSVATRASIAIQTSGNAATLVPAVYGCNLNANTTYNEAADGEWVACNYMSWADCAAYLQWSGLRPMTELEFEKACRGSLNPVANDFAWGDATINNSSSALTLSSAGASNENVESAHYSTTTGNAAHRNNMFGTNGVHLRAPLRVGIFSANANNTGRATSGATYYGIMEMSGNLWERLVTISTTEGRNYTGLHGNGVLNQNGNATRDFWPGLSNGEVSDLLGSGLRGGSVTSSPTSTCCLFVSARGFTSSLVNERNWDLGFRGVRSTSSIADNGLVLHLDAGNTASYPGTGTTWTDLTGNGNNATLVNFTFNAANGGSIDFNSISTRATVAASSTIPYGSSARTLNMWIYTVASSWARDQNNVFFYGTGGDNYSFGLDMDYIYPQMQFWVYGSNDLYWTTTFNEVGWKNICITYDTDRNVRIYENGVLTQNYLIPTALNTTANTPISIGCEGDNRYFDGRISAVYMYNRAITAAEVLQNFNALKGRYGL